MKSIIFLVLFGSIAAHFRDKASKIYIGTALDPGALSSDSQYKTMAAQEFNCMTAENQMKWDATEPSKGQNSFGAADTLVSFAKSNGMKIRGHTLIWHAQVPGWASSLSGNALKEAMHNHINAEVTHFKGSIYAWDVCNEIFNEDGTLRDSIWKKNFNDSFIADAFNLAHTADPEAKLYINDYNIEGVNAKSTGLYNLVQRLKSAGVPIHGVGIQSHLTTGAVPSTFAQNLKRFSDLGLDVALTELDIANKNGNDAQQATDYANVIKDCLNVPRCVGVTIWGFTDKHSWISSSKACPWDSNYKAKAAVAAIEAALK